jgi:hypothetical protein
MIRFRKTKAMQIAEKHLCLLVILSMSLVGTSISAVTSLQDKQNPPKPKPASEQPADIKKADGDSADNDQDEPVDEDLAPAAVQLDLSKSSPLIQTLYQATRETKEQQILTQLAQAKKLLDDRGDLKATDAQGRTALHWAVMGSSYNVKPKVLVAYEEIADAMIQRESRSTRKTSTRTLPSTTSYIPQALRFKRC